MSAITTHVLDTSTGRPAAGVPVTLEKQAGGGWQNVGQGVTNQDGRIADLLGGAKLARGTYRLSFDTATYFSTKQQSSFYPQVQVIFTVGDATQHYHVPLLLSPFGYSTYRGS
ncbi:MAG TPA: hydroxyisourate hydrolase [Terriglobales bacterium]|nr:hydroxyisourate hydrolase [Terriglobales bacterium]